MGRKRGGRGQEWDEREEVEVGSVEREGREDGSGMGGRRWKVRSGEGERRERREARGEG